MDLIKKMEKTEELLNELDEILIKFIFPNSSNIKLLEKSRLSWGMS